MISFIVRCKYWCLIAFIIFVFGGLLNVNVKKTFLAEIKSLIPFGGIEFFGSQKIYQSSEEVGTLDVEPLPSGEGVYVFKEIYNAEKFNLKHTFYFRGDYYEVIRNPSLFVGFLAGGPITKTSVFYGVIAKKIR